MGDGAVHADVKPGSARAEALAAVGAACGAGSGGGGAASGAVCAVVGPSGVGKSLLIKRLMAEHPSAFGFSVSHTTRAPRQGEVDGTDYHFVTRAAMEADIRAGLFVEHAEVHGNFYGTSLPSVEAVSSQGRVCLLDIDVQGAASVRRSALGPRASFVFLAPPSLDVLERRLRRRGSETEESIDRRLAGAKRELAVHEEEPQAWDLTLRWDDHNVDVAYASFRDFLVARRLPPPAEPAAAGVATLRRSPTGTGGVCVIAGPSGVGKSTLVKSLMAEFPGQFGFCVSHTTRQPRSGERDGVDYHFADLAAMERDIEAGLFLEHAEVHGNRYGTSATAVHHVMSSGKVCLLDIDVQGADAVRRSPLLAGKAAFVFFTPPCLATLEARLRGRGTEKEDAVQKRMAGARREVAAHDANPSEWDLTLCWRDEQLPEACAAFGEFMKKLVSPVGCDATGADGGACTSEEVIAQGAAESADGAPVPKRQKCDTGAIAPQACA